MSGATDEQVRVDRLDAQLVGVVKMDEVHRKLVAQVASACRDGLTAVRLANRVFLNGTTGATIVVTRETERLALEKDRDHWRRRQERARTAYLDELNPDLAHGYRDTVNEAASRLLEIDAALAALEAEERGENVDPGPSFATDADVVTGALRAIAIDGRHASQEQIHAAKVVLPEFGVLPLPDGSWQGFAVLRLPVDGGVVQTGPLTWPVRANRRSTAAARVRIDPGQTTAGSASRSDLVHDLVASGLTRNAAVVVASCPLPELAQVLLHRDAPEHLPAHIGSQWRDAAFVAHVTRVYVNRAALLPTLGHYANRSAPRQAVVDMLIAAGGRLSLRELVRREPTMLVRLHSALYPFAARRTKVPWRSPFTVELNAAGEKELVAVRCRCGRFARYVVRVPEVPTALLCECGRLAAPSGSVEPDDPTRDVAGPDGQELRLPDVYRSLAMSQAEWRAELDEFQPRGPRASTTAKHAAQRATVYEMLAARGVATTPEIAELLGTPLASAYNMLVDDPAIARVGKIKGRVAWRLADPSR